MASIAAANTFPELTPESVLIGQAAAMTSIRESLERVASCNLPVLIVGEPGAGKEMLARTIHLRSARPSGAFIRSNCASLMSALEQEIFGADSVRVGRFSPNIGETPRRGTLFLNEIADLSLPLQGQLLRLLEESCVLRVSGDPKLELRLICATRHDLRQAITEGTFREDLYYRINVLQMLLPSLRDRRDDIPYLVDHISTVMGGRGRSRFSAQLMQILQEYHWPGNIRELENLIKRYLVIGSESAITSELRRAGPAHFTSDIALDGKMSLKKMTRQAVREIERRVILESLQANNWNRKRVARELNISYRALLYKIQDAGLTSLHAAAKPVRTGSSDRHE